MINNINKMNNNKKALMYTLAFMLVVVCLSYVSAEVNEYAPVKQNDCVSIKQVCSSCSYVNLSVSYPNSTLAVTNAGMTAIGAGNWIYNYCSTNELGRYDVTGEGDISGKPTGFDVLWFDVTLSGEKPAGDITIVVFSLLFIVVIFFSIIYLFKILGHVIEFNVDLIDTAIMVGSYLAVWIFYFISHQYLGNKVLDDLLSLALKVGAITHVILPIVAFMVSFIMVNLEAKKKARYTY